jgi:crotonobetainyl-CoA:carnitine CoA-transferase CaiB-like acyl-CoA transferase
MLARTMTEWVTLMGSGERALRPDLQHEAGVRRPAGQASGHAAVLEHNSGSKAPSLANPIRFSDTPIRYQRSAPTLGEHTDRVLQDMLAFQPRPSTP